jgi:hypothetical protein
MSDPRVRCTVAWYTAVLAQLLAFLAPVAAAQSTDDFRRRVERLEQRHESVSSALERQRQATPVANLDTLTVGQVHLLHPAPARFFVARVAAMLGDSLRAMLGEDTVLVPRVTFLLRPRGPGSGHRPGLGRIEVQGVHTWFYQDQDTRYQKADIPEDVASGLLDVIRMHARWALDSRLSGWIEGALVFDTLTTIQAQTVYIELATTSWSVVRDCYEGRLDRCRDALALGSHGASTWYRPVIGASRQIRSHDSA